MTKGGGLFPSQAKPRKEGRKGRRKEGQKEGRKEEKTYFFLINKMIEGRTNFFLINEMTDSDSFHITKLKRNNETKY